MDINTAMRIVDHMVKNNPEYVKEVLDSVKRMQPENETFRFEIYYHNRMVVEEYFNTLEEATKRIDEWPWNYNADDCSASLWQKVRIRI